MHAGRSAPSLASSLLIGPARMHSWFLWLLLAALLVLPVILRAYAGDDEPSNETVHESSDGRERDPEPPLLAATA